MKNHIAGVLSIPDNGALAAGAQLERSAGVKVLTCYASHLESRRSYAQQAATLPRGRRSGTRGRDTAAAVT